MLLKTLAIISSLLVISCAGVTLPDKPQGNICTVDLPRLQLICAPINSAENIHDVFDKNFFETREVTKIPLSDVDKYIAFSPDTWGNVHIYIKNLENLIKNHCQ